MPKTESAIVERDHHKKAFSLYHAQGEKRSHRKVAAEMNVSLASVKNWSRVFNWQGRIWEKDAESARQLADKIMSDGTAETERNLKIVRAALMRLAKGIADGNVKLQIGDLDRLVRLEEHLVTSLRPAAVANGRAYGPVFVLPDNHTLYPLNPPAFVLPDDGSNPNFHGEEVTDSDGPTTPS